jgi:thioredoxin-dependent peroxiredoxin
VKVKRGFGFSFRCSVATAWLASASAMDSSKPAPDVALVDSTGRAVQLHALLGDKAVVLYFYPKDDTPGCTAEACSFRDQYEDFQKAGAEVIGVSADGESSHEAFKAKHRLPFTLLSDPSGAAAKAFGVKKTFGLIAGRVTYVIDKHKNIRHTFSSQLRVNKHVEEALAVVRGL